MAGWLSAIVAALALVVSAWTSFRQYQLAARQTALSTTQVQLASKVATRQEELAIAHSGAQTEMMWRHQVFMLHDRGLLPEEIRWIMCCEDEGVGHEQYNGIIDEVVRNVPRVPPEGMLGVPIDGKRRLPLPRGSMRADLDQDYTFGVAHEQSDV